MRFPPPLFRRSGYRVCSNDGVSLLLRGIESRAEESAGRIGLRNASTSLKETLDDLLARQTTALRLLNEFLVEYAAHTSAAPGAPTSPSVTAPNAGKLAAEAAAESANLTATGGKISSLLK